MTSGFDEYCRNRNSGTCTICGNRQAEEIDGERNHCRPCAVKAATWELEAAQRNLAALTNKGTAMSHTDDEPRCPACKTAWVAHLGSIGLCRQVQELTAERDRLAAVVRRVRDHLPIGLTYQNDDGDRFAFVDLLSAAIAKQPGAGGKQP
jgi:hypothetical protein